MLLIAMLTAPTSTDDGVPPLPATRPLIDIVVPVYNEQALEPSIRRLHRFLDDSFPFAWRIVIADNASTDATPTIAADLAARAAEHGAAAARRQGPRPGVARRLVAQPRRRRAVTWTSICRPT